MFEKTLFLNNHCLCLQYIISYHCSSAMQTDDFTRHLFEIHMKVTKSDVQVSLVINKAIFNDSGV